MRLKKSGTSNNDLENVPIFNIESDGKGLFYIATNEIGFRVIAEYLEMYASDANEQDSSNPYVQ